MSTIANRSLTQSLPDSIFMKSLRLLVRDSAQCIRRSWALINSPSIPSVIAVPNCFDTLSVVASAFSDSSYGVGIRPDEAILAPKVS